VIRKGLARLGLSGDWLRHGVRREVFVAPLAENAREFLRGEAEQPTYYPGTVSEMFSYFRQRWLLPRATRNMCWRQVQHEELRLSRQLQQ
jgi:hypothetical protein